MTKPDSHAGVNGPGAISQQMLRELRDARFEKNDANDRAYEIRCEVLDLIDSDAEVEAGPLVLRIKVEERQAITHAAVIDILGQDVLDALLAAIPSKTVRTVFLDGPGSRRRRQRTVDQHKEAMR